MAHKNSNLPRRQVPLGADERERKGWRGIAFDMFVATVLALLAAGVVDLALHPMRSDAQPKLKCDARITLADTDELMCFSQKTKNMGV